MDPDYQYDYDDHHHDHGHHHHHHDDEEVLPTQVLTVVGLCLSVVCLAGIIGNLLSAIVLVKNEMKSSTKRALLGLTFFDSLLLISYLTTFVLYAFDPYDGIHSHDLEETGSFYYIYTQFLFPILQTAYTGSVYSIVLITLERYIAVCKPFAMNRLLTSRVGLLAFITLFTFSILLNLPRWFELWPVTYSREVFNSKTNMTKVIVTEGELHHDTTYIKYYHGMVWISVMYVLPFLLLGVLNFCIWKQVKETNAKRAKMSSVQSEVSITKMLLIVVSVFLVCNAINCLLLIIFAIFQKEHHAYIVGYAIAGPLIVNSSVNIVIYCVKGKAFRKQFVKMLQKWKSRLFCGFRCRCCCYKANSMGPGTNTTRLPNSSTNASSSSSNSSKPVPPTVIYLIKRHDSSSEGNNALN